MNENSKKYTCMQCKNGCCVSFFEKLHITAQEKELLEQEAKKRNLKIKISKEKSFAIKNEHADNFIYFLALPCPFYEVDLGCTIHKIKPVMCKIYPLRNIKQISKKEYYFVIDHKCSWVKNNPEVFENPYRNLFKIFKTEFEIYINSIINYLVTN